MLICLAVATLLLGITLIVAPRQWFNVCCGAGLGIMDLWLISLIVHEFVGKRLTRKRAVLLGFFAVGKVALIVFLLYIIVVRVRMGALGLFLGLATVPLGVGVLGLYGLLRKS